MEVMIVIVFLNLQTKYDEIIIALCDNVEEIKEENQLDKKYYCDNV